MDIRIKATDFEMTPGVQDYLDERLQTIEKHLGDGADVARCEIELGRAAGHSQRGENWFSEIQIIIPGKEDLRVVAHAESVNASIDAMKDEILGRVTKNKSKRFALTRKAGARIKDWLRWGS